MISYVGYTEYSWTELLKKLLISEELELEQKLKILCYWKFCRACFSNASFYKQFHEMQARFMYLITIYV